MNKKYSVILNLIITLIVMMYLPITVYANSSWHWLTTSPMTVLPYAVILTLIIETFLIIKFGKVNNTKKTFCIVSLANLMSFVAPYLERAYRFIPTSGGYDISAAFYKGPYFIVLIGYLLLTIIVEVPVVYFLLRRDTQSRKALFVTVIIANILTTIAVAVIERLVCIGQW